LRATATRATKQDHAMHGIHANKTVNIPFLASRLVVEKRVPGCGVSLQMKSIRPEDEQEPTSLLFKYC
jgi:hypothetical protein